MVFQLDTDILSDLRFQNWTNEHYDYSVANLADPVERGKEITTIIEIVGGFATLSIADLNGTFPHHP